MGLYHLLKTFEGLGAYDRRPVDNKARRALHTQLLRHLCFLLDNFRIFSGVQALVELVFIQSYLGCKLLEIVLAERATIFTILVFVEIIVVFPERALFSSALACFCRPLRFWTQESKMNVTNANSTVLQVCFFDLTPRASGEPPTIRSLEIAKLDQGHRGIRVPFKMPGLGDQVIHHLFIPGCGVWRLRSCIVPGHNRLFAAPQQRSSEISAQQSQEQHDNCHNRRCPGLDMDRNRRATFGRFFRNIPYFLCFFHSTSQYYLSLILSCHPIGLIIADEMAGHTPQYRSDILIGALLL